MPSNGCYWDLCFVLMMLDYIIGRLLLTHMIGGSLGLRLYGKDDMGRWEGEKSLDSKLEYSVAPSSMRGIIDEVWY